MFAAIGCTQSDPKPSAPAAESAATSADKPAAANAASDKPATANAASDKPAAANAAADKPAAANAASDKPAVGDMRAIPPKLTAADRAADNSAPAANSPADKPTADVPVDKTADNQRVETAADLAISQQVRSDVVRADAMSTDAKNVSINTQGGVVTLRGPVASAREKKDIAAIVKRVDGVKRIDNQMQVAAK
jgi:osmotically-inducible protein OsmY